MKFSRLILGFLFLSLLRAAPAVAEPGGTPSTGQTVYVPVYSHIYSGDRDTPFYLAVTVSIRNTDPKSSIKIIAANYHDSNGRVVNRYLQDPVTIDALSSKEYVIKESDKDGGSGAFFIFEWAAEKEVNPPLIESVMIGTHRQQGISFTSRGQVITKK